jgi:hypothetical protein
LRRTQRFYANGVPPEAGTPLFRNLFFSIGLKCVSGAAARIRGRHVPRAPETGRVAPVCGVQALREQTSHITAHSGLQSGLTAHLETDLSQNTVDGLVKGP